MNIDELLSQYADGERDFGAINLQSANLTGLELSGIATDSTLRTTINSQSTLLKASSTDLS